MAEGCTAVLAAGAGAAAAAALPTWLPIVNFGVLLAIAYKKLEHLEFYLNGEYMSIVFLIISLACIGLNYYSGQDYFAIGAAISAISVYLCLKLEISDMRTKMQSLFDKWQEATARDKTL